MYAKDSNLPESLKLYFQSVPNINVPCAVDGIFAQLTAGLFSAVSNSVTGLESFCSLEEFHAAATMDRANILHELATPPQECPEQLKLLNIAISILQTHFRELSSSSEIESLVTDIFAEKFALENWHSGLSSAKYVFSLSVRDLSMSFQLDGDDLTIEIQ